MCACVCVCMGTCVCEKERERERKEESMCVCLHTCVSMCVCVSHPVWFVHCRSISLSSFSSHCYPWKVMLSAPNVVVLISYLCTFVLYCLTDERCSMIWGDGCCISSGQA